MKKIIFVCLLLLSFSSKADQLAYISKSQAEQAVAAIQKKGVVYLFCGCCSIEAPKKVKYKSVYFKHTGYDDYYEVYIDFIDESGELKTTPVDLAYVWQRKLFSYRTIGEVLELEHNRCADLKKWKEALKNEEKDI